MEILWKLVRVLALVAVGSNLTRVYYAPDSLLFSGNPTIHFIISAVVIVGAINAVFDNGIS